MSFASFSTRVESRPARTSACGEQVDSARMVISSPDATRSTGWPAASYHPHATVVGVGRIVCVWPVAGAGQAAAAPRDAAGAFELLTEGGVWPPSADPPPRIASAEVIR